MDRESLKKWMEDSVEVRPLDEHGERDGNHNYIHRTKVAELIAKLRKGKENIMDEGQKVTELTEADVKEMVRSLMDEVNKCNAYSGASLEMSILTDKKTQILSKITVVYERYPYLS